MKLNEHALEEINLLSLFNLDSMGSGIKVHEQQASEQAIAAAKRLYDKGLTDHVDGGYLTLKGVEAAKHAQVLARLLAE